MASFTQENQSFHKKFDTKKIVYFVIAVGLFFSTLYIISTVLPPPSSDESLPLENYTDVTLALYQTHNYTQEGMEYEFKYAPGGQGNLLQVSLEKETLSYAAIAGATYDPFDLNVTIYSATEKMLILRIATA